MKGSFPMHSFVAILGGMALLASPLMALAGPKTGPLVGNEKLNFTSPANPPLLNWPAQEGVSNYKIQLSQNKQFPAARTIAADVNRNFYTPERYLTEGVWYYRIQPKGGRWSDSYTVTIAKDAIRFLIPKRTSYVNAHPRLYFRAEEIPAFQKDAKGAKKVMWAKIEEKAKGLIGAPLVPEPPRWKPLPDGSLDIEAWRRVVNAGGKAGTDLITLSFAYVVTKDPAYLKEAERYTDYICSWQIPGSTADPSHVDHPARDLLHALSITYDWLYNDMNPELRTKLRETIVRRADKLYEFENPFYIMGTNNHPWLRMAALADAGAVLLGDDPHAEEWLDYAEQMYAGRFWCLGGRDGEWHEGISYWSYALLFALEFADVVRSSTGVDFYKHPWIQQAANFPIYAYTPGTYGLPFGDVHPGLQDVATQLSEMRLAKATRNPYAKWWVDHPFESSQLFVQRFIADDTTLTAKAPTDLLQSIWFRDAGWAVFHTQLTGKDDVFFSMKSGQFFASGHEHPDQNSFALEAYGQRMLIDSGYYDWYSSKHHYGWVMRTKAHNVIMVDGEGQAGPFEGDQHGADGKILAFFRSPEIDYCVGDASNPKIYKGKVTNFIRSVAFLKSNIIVMMDRIALAKPSKLDWLLHTTAEPKMDPGNTGFDVKIKGAGLRVRLIPSGQPQLELTKSVGYPDPPEKMNPQDYHLTFSLPGQVDGTQLLSVYEPYKVSSGAPNRKLTRVEGEGAVGAWIDTDMVLFRTDSARQMVSVERLKTDGQMATMSADGGWSVCAGKVLQIGDRQILRSSGSISASMKNGQCHISAEKPTNVKITLPEAPAKVKQGWRYDKKTRMLSGQVPAGETSLKIK